MLCLSKRECASSICSMLSTVSQVLQPSNASPASRWKPPQRKSKAALDLIQKHSSPEILPRREPPGLTGPATEVVKTDDWES